MLKKTYQIYGKIYHDRRKLFLQDVLHHCQQYHHRLENQHLLIKYYVYTFPSNVCVEYTFANILESERNEKFTLIFEFHQTTPHKYNTIIYIIGRGQEWVTF